MSVTKYELKIMNYIYRNTVSQFLKWKHHPIPYSSLTSRFQRNIVDDLFYRDLLRHEFIYEDNNNENVPVLLTAKGMVEVESHQWFDLQYVITQIIVPVVIGIISAIITNLVLY